LATAERAATAATLALTYPTRAGRRIILIRRPASLRRHPDQIAFPGGMIEPSDSSSLAAAIRETQEELGLRLAPDVAALPLTPVQTATGDVVVQPFWVQLPASPRLRPSPAEVAAVLRVPLSDLRDPKAQGSIPHPRRPEDQLPCYRWRGEIIWGVTYRSVAELVALLGEESVS
jgi:8-oxo-dGTP pyrophosphatase MutT (NUDIX family)